MDALAAAAALAVVLKESQEAALREALLDRERAAMTAEDRGSLLAQRLFTGSTQVPSTMRPMTWRAAYEQRHEDYLLAHDAMRAALLAVRQADDERAEALLAAELGSSSEEEEEEGEEEEEEEVEEEEAPTAA